MLLHFVAGFVLCLLALVAAVMVCQAVLCALHPVRTGWIALGAFLSGLLWLAASRIAIPWLVPQRASASVSLWADVASLFVTASLGAAAAARFALGSAGSALADLPTAVLRVDRLGRVAYANAAAEKLLGQSRAELARQSRPFWHLLEANGASAQEALPAVSGVSEVSTRLERRVASTGRTVVVSIHPVQNLWGRGCGAYVCLEDVTERRQWQRERQEAERLSTLGLLAGSAAHDFNNLLQVVRGNLEYARFTLTEQSAQRDDLYQYLDEALQAVRRASQVATRLLAASHDEGSSALEPGHLAPLLAEAIPVALRGSAVQVSWEVAADLAPVLMDAGQIHQVLLNIALNAAQAMPQGGRLTVRAHNLELAEGTCSLHPGAYVCVEIEDSGHGIAPEHLPHIFEPYFTTKAQGHGLGLAAAKGVLRRHGGTIAVESTVGVGTTFRLLLPQAGSVGTDA